MKVAAFATPHVGWDLALSAALAHTLANQYVAVFLGLLFAAGLLAASRASVRRIRPDASPVDLLITSISLFGRLAIAVLAIWAYKRFIPEGFRPFAISLAGGFVLFYTIVLVRYGNLKKYRRPVRPQGR